MSLAPVVSNSSPLIALEQIGHLHLLENLFSSVLVPSAVTQEVAPTVALPAWINERSLLQPIGPQILSVSLGLGESEAISLALEQSARLIILDDRPARRMAESLGLTVIGTLGILLASKRRGFITEFRACADALIAAGFYISADLYRRILLDAGENS